MTTYFEAAFMLPPHQLHGACPVSWNTSSRCPACCSMQEGPQFQTSTSNPYSSMEPKGLASKVVQTAQTVQTGHTKHRTLGAVQAKHRHSTRRMQDTGHKAHRSLPGAFFACTTRPWWCSRSFAFCDALRSGRCWSGSLQQAHSRVLPACHDSVKPNRALSLQWKCVRLHESTCIASCKCVNQS